MMLFMTVLSFAADKDSKDKTVKRLDNYIAVFDLETKDVDKKISRPLTDSIILELVKEGKYEVIDRNNMDKILKEWEFQQSGCVARECAVEAGKMLGVGKVIIGSVNIVGKTYYLSLQLVNVTTGKIENISEDTCRCELDDLILSSKRLAKRLMGEMAAEPQVTTKSESPKTTSGSVTSNTKAVIETRLGSIELKFFPDVAPNHVNNFIELAKKGFYDGTIFHRVIPGFMIQGGDPNTKNPDKSKHGLGGPGYNVKAEFNNKPHKRGILSMARAANPDSAGSQFFICVADAPFLDKQYTVFGEVVSGMEVADKIVNQPRDKRDNPNERIEMKVKITEK